MCLSVETPGYFSRLSAWWQILFIYFLFTLSLCLLPLHPPVKPPFRLCSNANKIVSFFCFEATAFWITLLFKINFKLPGLVYKTIQHWILLIPPMIDFAYLLVSLLACAKNLSYSLFCTWGSGTDSTSFPTWRGFPHTLENWGQNIILSGHFPDSPVEFVYLSSLLLPKRINYYHKLIHSFTIIPTSLGLSLPLRLPF